MASLEGKNYILFIHLSKKEIFQQYQRTHFHQALEQYLILSIFSKVRFT